MQSTFRQLSLDERDAVADLIDQAGWKPFMSLIEGLAREQEEKVLKLAVDDGEQKLVHAKLRAEGARSLASDITKFPSLIKKLQRG